MSKLYGLKKLLNITAIWFHIGEISNQILINYCKDRNLEAFLSSYGFRNFKLYMKNFIYPWAKNFTGMAKRMDRMMKVLDKDLTPETQFKWVEADGVWYLQAMNRQLGSGKEVMIYSEYYWDHLYTVVSLNLVMKQLIFVLEIKT